MVKEHIMGLTLDKKIQAQFDKIDTKTKTAFTREYNKSHKEITKGPTKKGGKKVKDEKPSPSQHDESEDAQSSESEEEQQLLDEEEMKEIAKAKREEKMQKKANAAMKKIQKRQELSLVQKVETDKKAAPKKGGKKK